MYNSLMICNLQGQWRCVVVLMRFFSLVSHTNQQFSLKDLKADVTSTSGWLLQIVNMS